MSGFGNSKTINNESSVINSGTNLVVNSIVTTSPTVPFACGAITVTGDVISSGDVNIGANTVRAGTVETGFIRCNYMNSPTGEVNGPMILDPNYSTNNYVRIQDKLQVNGVSEFLGDMISTGTLSTTGLITNSIVSSGSNGPLIIDPNYSTNNHVLIHDKLLVNGTINSTGNASFGSILYINDSGQNANFQMTNYGHCHMNMPSSGNTFNMNCNLWVISFGIVSDDRIKANESVITNATETLLKLRPENYDKYDNFGLTGEYRRESGLIAQEVYNIEELRHLVGIPHDASGDLTTTNSTNPQNDPNLDNWGSTPASVNYLGLIPFLIKSIQELNQRIYQLEHP